MVSHSVQDHTCLIRIIVQNNQIGTNFVKINYFNFFINMESSDLLPIIHRVQIWELIKMSKDQKKIF